MFLRQRATQAEYFDSPARSAAEVAEGYRLLGRVNRLLVFAEPFQRLLPKLLGPDKCRFVSLLDLGAGDGSLGAKLTGWAATRGWCWQVTNLELNPLALNLNGERDRNVAGSALALPFRDESFDAVIATQMAHHLGSDAEVLQHFREAWRVTRDLVFVNDLHRNAGLYTFIWFLLYAQRCPAQFRADGLLSVKRGWRVNEWRHLAQQAGLRNTRVWLYSGAKVMLQARKRC